MLYSPSKLQLILYLGLSDIISIYFPFFFFQSPSLAKDPDLHLLYDSFILKSCHLGTGQSFKLAYLLG